MADAAVVIYNQAGDLIVDSRNVNMFLRYSGVTGGDRYNNITVSCLDPVLFFRPISGFGGVDSMDMEEAHTSSGFVANANTTCSTALG